MFNSWGTAKYIRLGELNLATNDDADPQDFDIIQKINHPMRVVPIKYHDIALLKMDRPTKFNEYIRPACLHFTTNIPKNRYNYSSPIGKHIQMNFFPDILQLVGVKQKTQHLAIICKK